MDLAARIAYWRKQVAIMDAEVAAGLLQPDDGAHATCRNTLRELLDIDGAPDAGVPDVDRAVSDGA